MTDHSRSVGQLPPCGPPLPARSVDCRTPCRCGSGLGHGAHGRPVTRDPVDARVRCRCRHDRQHGACDWLVTLGSCRSPGCGSAGRRDGACSRFRPVERPRRKPGGRPFARVAGLPSTLLGRRVRPTTTFVLLMPGSRGRDGARSGRSQLSLTPARNLGRRVQICRSETRDLTDIFCLRTRWPCVSLTSYRRGGSLERR